MPSVMLREVLSCVWPDPVYETSQVASHLRLQKAHESSNIKLPPQLTCPHDAERQNGGDFLLLGSGGVLLPGPFDQASFYA